MLPYGRKAGDAPMGWNEHIIVPNKSFSENVGSVEQKEINLLCLRELPRIKPPAACTFAYDYETISFLNGV